MTVTVNEGEWADENSQLGNSGLQNGAVDGHFDNLSSEPSYSSASTPGLDDGCYTPQTSVYDSPMGSTSARGGFRGAYKFGSVGDSGGVGIGHWDGVVGGEECKCTYIASVSG